VLTDAGEKKGHEVAARFEQMRAMFGQLLMRGKLRMSEPIEIIALRNDKDYAQLAPIWNGQPISSSAFYLPGEDRIYIVLNLFDPDSWRAVEHPFAHYLLNYNYPPTQPWFDEGFAEYFSSLRFTPKQVEIGNDPELGPSSASQVPLGEATGGNISKSFTEMLSAPVWLSWPDVLSMQNRVVNGQEGTHRTLFYAQSWILVHYLLNKNRLPNTGKYFDLVENQRVAPDQAIQQALGMSVAQLDQAVKDYFHSLKPLFEDLDASKQSMLGVFPNPVYQLPLPFTVDDVATSSKQVPLPEAQALVNEMELRIPEHREEAFQKLQALTSDPKTETTAAHRALAWAYVRLNQTKEAFLELNDAMHLNASDPGVRLGLALAAYHSGEKGARVQGLANMMESLQIVINEHPDFAEAYNMLGWARLTGGGANSALEAMRMAVQLSPRNEEYQLRLARALLAAKKFDDATGTLDRLALSQNPKISSAAKKDLNDLPFLKKYGIPPAEDAANKAVSSTDDFDKPANFEKADAPDKDTEKDDESPAHPKAAQPDIDKRPVKFAKATLLSVDCSTAPAAVLAISQGSKTIRLRAADYKTVAVIGAEQFSCGWKSIPVNINYRPGGKLDGDLVSIEIH
jgi:tetratricopeptide (TPR) repeat protein